MIKVLKVRSVMALAVSAAAGVFTVGAANSVTAAECTTESLRDARETFNTGIRENDLEAIALVLDRDVVLVTGTDSDQFIGRDRQIEIWASDADDPARLIYKRETSEVSLSPLYPIAMELGRWTGASPIGDEVGGEYSAKWRCTSDQWLLEAEIFMTTRCTGTLCTD
ncbi:nuclear transport factor 2 family protein [Congregibacter variabilis]|uniref:Nuclear transport factor 2 family protein n=1 Tax=Congregibacter variabilis TaxID=3081200 RepID=A0ABZ0I7G0_9GAMM|nr:nuclear transport factor 2 family protein [Congregibacter sp. IMCC43200]